eukprot:s2945_g5.t1
MQYSIPRFTLFLQRSGLTAGCRQTCFCALNWEHSEAARYRRAPERPRAAPPVHFRRVDGSKRSKILGGMLGAWGQMNAGGLWRI